MKYLILPIALLLLFGCLGTGETQNPSEIPEEEPPEVNINIEVEEQQNVTIEETVSNEGEELEEEEEPVPEFSTKETDPLGIYFLNVADKKTHGRSVIIKKGDFDMVVDVGPQKYGGRVVDFLRSRNVDDIEVLVLTTKDPQSSGGLQTVLKEFEVDEIWTSYADAPYENKRLVEKGDVFEYAGMKVEVLNPPKERFDDPDLDSIVLRITDKNTSVLLTSNILRGAQVKLYTDGDPSADILQAPYYGASIATAHVQLFLQKVDPEYVIVDGSESEEISMGGPRDYFFRVLDLYDIPWVATYQNGTLRVLITENGYTIEPITMQQ